MNQSLSSHDEAETSDPCQSALHCGTHLCFALRCRTQFSESKDASFCAGISHYHLDPPGAKKEEGILRFKRIFKSMGPLGMCFPECYLQATKNKRAEEDSSQSLSHRRNITKSTFIFNLVLSHKN